MGGRGVRLKYLHAFRDRTGTLRFYFRRNGIRTKLPGAFGSREFLDAYAAALGEQSAEPAERKATLPGSFRALATRYFASPQFLSLSATSQINYRRAIDRFLVEHGHRRVDQMKREHVDAVLGKFADKPGAGIILLKRMRTLLRYAMEIGWRDSDPTAGVRAFKSVEIHTWTESEIDQFETRWPIETKQRLAFDLLLYTGQRGGDVARMARPTAGEKIRVVQQKTGAPLTITVHPELLRSLEACPSGHLAAIVTAYGAPFSIKGFGQFMSDAIREAGLPPYCKAHGLRKAAARRLAEAGCSAHEIMAVTGHKTLSEVERYTRAAEQERLNAAAMAKQLENKRLANLPEQVGKHIEAKEKKSRVALPRGLEPLFSP
jgi:enterobacteria phage integrase